jgi:hypothetical protein
MLPLYYIQTRSINLGPPPIRPRLLSLSLHRRMPVLTTNVVHLPVLWILGPTLVILTMIQIT